MSGTKLIELLTLLVGTVTLVVLIIYAGYTRRQADAAERSLDAQTRSLAMHDRPWLLLDNVSTPSIQPNAKMIFQLRNSGALPATDVKIESSQVITRDDPSKLDEVVRQNNALLNIEQQLEDAPVAVVNAGGSVSFPLPLDQNATNAAAAISHGDFTFTRSESSNIQPRAWTRTRPHTRRSTASSITRKRRPG